MDGGRIFLSEDKNTMAMLILKGTDEIFCDGAPMKRLIANTTDAAQEKHVPVVEVDGKKITVKVGSVAHPMTDAHLIQWVYLKTKNGGQYKVLTPSDSPMATFIVADDDEPIAAYEYCNLHGLWVAKV